MIASPVLLDTPVALNLLASGASVALLENLGTRCYVCSAVIAEVLYIRSDDPMQPREAVSMDLWLDANTVQTVSPDGPLEAELYVQFAAQLDDGEAMSLAICRSRGFALATDDRKARRIAGQLVPPTMQLVSTAQIVHDWARKARVGPDELNRLLAAIELRARFTPPHDDPLREWWVRAR